MKLVAEYRRRALAVVTLADHVGSDDVARELHKIARLWDRLAMIREKRLKSGQQSHGNESHEQ